MYEENSTVFLCGFLLFCFGFFLCFVLFFLAEGDESEDWSIGQFTCFLGDLIPWGGCDARFV